MRPKSDPKVKVVQAKLKLFNSRSRQIEDFIPRQGNQVGLYTCGPTVYSYAHIGNMRAYVFADTLRRALINFGYELTHVMNITDVGHLTDDADSGDDKMELGAKREGLTAWDVAQKYTDAFFEHAGELNITKPDVICKATDHIGEQIKMVQDLEARGFTYSTADGVYFDTSKFTDYAKFARLDVEGLNEGHRVEASDKKQKTDFALWKLSNPEDKRAMEWDSPWGRGFPGWHIECSAMATHFLGTQFDIHTGGIDHIPVHHTNEIAQAECALEVHPWVNFWMHCEFLVIEDAEKMSKSLGNVLTVASLKDEGVDPRAYRLLLLQSHYRKQLKFSMENLKSAQKFLSRLVASVDLIKNADEEPLGAAETYVETLYAAIADDLSTPTAVAQLGAMLDDEKLAPGQKRAAWQRFESLLGLELQNPIMQSQAPNEVLEYLAQRNQARKDKNWGEADRLRDLIHQAGYEILDGGDGSSSVRKK